MKAVNLIPSDSGGGSRRSGIPFGPTHALLAFLAVAVALVTIYVLTSNTISERRVKLAQLQQQVNQQQAEASQLTKYANFVKLAQKRIQTVRQIASTRFDWHGALRDLSQVVPADTSLQTLTASVAPGDSAGNGSSPGSTSVRADVTAPAFEMTGCTKTQDDVAQLMSRLRLINGVTRVTLEDSQKQVQSQGGSSVSTATTGPSTGAQGCGPNTPNFDLVVFFAPLPGEESSSATGAPAATPTSTTSSTTSTTSTTSSTTTSGSSP